MLKALVSFLVLILCGAGLPAPVASAQPPDMSAIHSAERWVGMSQRGDGNGPLQMAITEVEPQVAAVGQKLRIKLQLTNNSTNPVADVTLRAQRMDGLVDAEAAERAMAEPEAAFGVVTEFSQPFDIPAGGSVAQVVEVALSDPAPTGLGITQAGVYPVLINANGRPSDDIVQLLAETRTLVPVLTDGITEEPVDEPYSAAPRPVSLVWPIADYSPLQPGEVKDDVLGPELMLYNHSLSDSMASGILNARVESLTDLQGSAGAQVRAATCVAIDPEVLLTASRMADGYLVGTQRHDPASSGTRLRDSWGHNDDGNALPAEDADIARDWLDRLRRVTADMCVVALPWASAQANAVAAVGDPEISGIWFRDGATTVAGILGRPVLTDVVLPPEGYLTNDAADLVSRYAVQSARYTALVADTTVGIDGKAVEPGAAMMVRPSVRALAASAPLSTALAATGTNPGITGFSHPESRHTLRLDSTAARMQAAVGTMYQELRDGGPGPLIVLPPPDWSALRSESTQFFSALTQATAEGLVRPVPLPEAIKPPDAKAGEQPGAIRGVADDPTALTSEEIAEARSIAQGIDKLTSLMVPSDNTELTPVDFSRPLRRDVLRMLSTVDRHSRGRLSNITAKRNAYISQTTWLMVRRLRESVRLLAPGGLYTSTTKASPVAVVASNGLPLPVPAQVVLSGQDMPEPLVEQAVLPPKGSLTLQLYPNVDPGDKRRSELAMVLQTPQALPISAPVSITVQYGPGVTSLLVITGVGLLAGLGWVIGRTRRRDDKIRS